MTSAFPLPIHEALSPTEVLAELAHELRQPLSSIESIAYYLAMVTPQGDARTQSELARIRQLVDQAGSILSDTLRRSGYAPAMEAPIAEEASSHETADAFDSRQLSLMDLDLPTDVA
jgi:signal transduction histidine kinase